MSKAANTYWDNGRTMPGIRSARGAGVSKTRVTRGADRIMPRWFAFAIPVLLSAMVVLTLNVRAWTNVQNEYQTNQQLNAEIERLTSENGSLQEEIHRLRYDPKTIEREARKLGMGRMNEKVFVPTQ